jgi:hypothetical protein
MNQKDASWRLNKFIMRLLLLLLMEQESSLYRQQGKVKLYLSL